MNKKISFKPKVYICGVIVFASIYFIWWQLCKAVTLKDLGLNSLFILVVSVFFLKVMNKYKVFSFGFFFAVFTWVFHFGIFPLFYFESEELIIANDLRYYSFDSIMDGYKICVLFYFALLLGMSFNKLVRIPNFSNTYIIGSKTVRTVALFFIVLLIPYMFNVFRYLSLSGYIAVRRQGMSSFQAYLNEFLYFFAIILYYKANKIECKWAKIIIVLCFLPTLFAGERGTAVCLIVVLAIISFQSKTINLKNLGLILGISIFSIYIINTIGRYRLNFDTMMSQLIDYENFKYFLSNNPLFNLLGEFGGTFTTPLVTVRNYTEEIDYLYGASYLSSITMIVPGLNRIVPSNILIYTYSIPAVDQHHLGGSFIGEAYANFGIFGFFPVVLLGNIVKEIDKIRIDENNELYACWIYMLEFILLMIIRGFIKNIVFWAFWGYIMVYLTAIYNPYLRRETINE